MNFYKTIFPVLLFILILIGCGDNSTGPDTDSQCDISVTPSSVELGLGESETISASTTEGCSGSISWESSDSDIVSLDKNSGNSIEVTGQSEGDASIKASIKDQDGNLKEAKTDASIIFNPVVVYQKQTDGNQQSSDVWVADKNGNEKQITQEGDNWDGIQWPAQWIENGEKIGYIKHVDSPIYSINPDGSDKKDITPENINPDGFRFSPDGKKLAFTGTHDGNTSSTSKYVQNLETNELTEIAGEELGNVRHTAPPTWSPNNDKVVFAVIDDQDNYDIFAKNADGSGEAKNITNSPNTTEGLPLWSPFDSNKIAFISDMSGKLSTHVMNSDGSNAQLIIEGMFCTSWISEDELACMGRNENDNFDIYKVNLDGSHEVFIESSENNMYPDWQTEND